MAERDNDGTAVERGPGAAYAAFVLMEELLDKLKLLSYEEEALRQHNVRPLSRHYFALPTNPGEQFFVFCTLAAWLIVKAGHHFEQPQEYDDPNAIISKILSELRSFGRPVDFPPAKLKSGYGEQACYVLDCLAEEALKYSGFSWKRPLYPTDELEEEEITEEDTELTLNKLEEDIAEEESDNEENFIDLNVLKAQTYRSDVKDSTKREEILLSTTDAAEWNLEVERVLPQLKVTVRTDNKCSKLYAVLEMRPRSAAPDAPQDTVDSLSCHSTQLTQIPLADWRIHVDQMHQHKDGIESSLKETRGYLDKFHNEISRTLEKINSREKYINNQLEHLIQEYRSAQALLSEAKEKYQEGSGGVTERIRVLSEITEVLEKVKQETEEKGSSMTDGTPLVRIKQALTKLKQETIQMDIQIGVMEHTLLQSKLKEKSNMTRDMNAAMIPEATIGAY
ncbi:intraflagellar transport protein 57 homolog isoform X1 [Phasianus colchicus]|uniref:intraflagellar transport protein 57 homolog isoform X1 n=1 Tax=Phasianus colchicus TaxID=9054 RepID=UPI00129E2D5B|nr:intraflagellar transport protein 57 homolog isoform X1 [Phasianus colchicus]